MIIPSIKIKKILFATDLSKNALYSFGYAVSLANLYGAGLTLLHVLPEVSESLDAHVVGYIEADRWEEIKNRNFRDVQEALQGRLKARAAVKEALDQFCRNTRAISVDHEFVTDEILVERGNPVKLIIKCAEEKNCDLIVMGAHGHGALIDAMLGSTTQRVVRRSKTPVLVVRLPEDD